MNTIKQKILKTDFKKFFRTFIPLTLILSLCGAAAAGLSLRPQISEDLSYDHMLDGQIHHPGLDGEWKDIFFASDPGMGVKILLLTLTVCFLLLMAVYWFSTAAALYKSAVSAGMNGPLWGAAALALNLAAVIIFIITRSFMRQRCPSCGKWQPIDFEYCSECGEHLVKKCRQCDCACGFGDKFCKNCGSLLNDK